MKLSVSLPDEEIEFVDAYAEDQGIRSRSAVLLRAVRLLRAVELGGAYQEAWDEWARSGDADRWEPALADGIDS